MADARVEQLGPAETIMSSLMGHADHAVHNRPGFVTPAAGVTGGVVWSPVTHKEEEGQGKVVYKQVKLGKKTQLQRVGVLRDDGKIIEGGRVVGEYRFRERRLECVVHRKTLQIVDSGICLTSHTTGEKGDTYFTLESLPSVVGEALDRGVLHVYRHVDHYDDDTDEEDY